MRVFVTGAHGQVAQSLREAAAADPSIVMGFAARPEVDLARPESVLPAMEAFRPDLVVNPAAYTAVDRAEDEPELAFAINRDGAAAVAKAAARLEVPIIHLSTDYVFDGAKAEPYVESDPIAPIGVYGRSKAEGEMAVAQANGRHVILRTAWVYAPFGANFVRTMLRLAGERDVLRVVDDQIGCPTYAPDIASVVLQIGRQIVDGRMTHTHAGVTHLAGPDAMSWRQFASAVMAGLAERGGRAATIEAITTADYPTRAQRPANSRLATRRLQELFAVHMPAMPQSLGRCLDHLVGSVQDSQRSCT